MSYSEGKVVQSETRSWTLKKEEELRIDVEGDQKITITLISGTAELFGSELCIDQTYTLSDRKVAIFTWHGAEITVVGLCKMANTATDTPMVSYINTHAALENMRQQAKKNNTRGPVALICGPADSGKSTLSRILINYAVRAGHAPLFVDADVGQNAIAIPGSLAATGVEQPISVESGDMLGIKAPLVHYYGHAGPGQVEMYKQFVDRLAITVNKRLSVSDISRTSGVIINSCGWSEGAGYDLILHIADRFNIDVMLIIDYRLFTQMKEDNRIKPSIKLTQFNKSNGVVSRTASVRTHNRNRSIREYFYGPSNDQLFPHQKIISFRDVQIYRVGGGPAAPASALPIGTTRLIDPNALTKIQPSLELLHSVMAISYATEVSSMLQHNVAGFVYVSAVDLQKKTLTLLVPAPGPLPSNSFLTGTIKWYD